jgi:hypothetical protein
VIAQRRPAGSRTGPEAEHGPLEHETILPFVEIAKRCDISLLAAEPQVHERGVRAVATLAE